LSAEDEQLIQRLAQLSEMPRVPQPQHFTGTLRAYQQEGYYWLSFLYAHQFGACLADDMGLGKTVQAIAFLGGIAEGVVLRNGKHITGLRHLIVMPPTLIFNWKAELAAFYPAFRVTEYVGQELAELAAYDIVLTTYDRVRINIEELKKELFHVILFDEAQYIKNIQAARTAAARQLKGLFAITLTGTPLENHIGEYYSVLDLSMPGLLPAYKEFMKYARNEQDGEYLKRTRPFVLRRTKGAILKDLPDRDFTEPGVLESLNFFMQCAH
jgi:non-specific serine/threonine protein kinase